MRIRQGLYGGLLIVALSAPIAWADAFSAESQLSTPQEARQAVKIMQDQGESLKDAIEIAEKHTNGKAVSARVVMASDMRTTGTGQVSDAQRRRQQRDEDEESKATAESASGQVRFVVTCLVDETNLRDVVVDPREGKVVSVRNAADFGQRFAQRQSSGQMYGQPQRSQEDWQQQYDRQTYDQRQYDQQQYGQSQDHQQRYGQSQFEQQRYGQSQFDQQRYGQQPYEQQGTRGSDWQYDQQQRRGSDWQYDRNRQASGDWGRVPVDERYIEHNAWPRDYWDDFDHTHPGSSRGGPAGVTHHGGSQYDSSQDRYRSRPYEQDYRVSSYDYDRYDRRYGDRSGQRSWQDQDRYGDRRWAGEEYRTGYRDDFMTHRGPESVVLVSELIKAKAVNYRGEDLGKIDDAALDWQNGRLAFAVLSHGGVLGIGEDKLAIPFRKVADLSDGEVQLQMTEEELQDAKGFSATDWPARISEMWAADDDDIWENADRRRDSRIYKASEVIGMTLRDEQNEEFGEIADVVVDAATGRLAYVIIERENDRRVVVPFGVVEMEGEEPVLSVTQHQVEQRGWKLVRNSNPNWGDRHWARQVHDNFGAPYYWQR